MRKYALITMVLAALFLTGCKEEKTDYEKFKDDVKDSLDYDKIKEDVKESADELGEEIFNNIMGTDNE